MVFIRLDSSLIKFSSFQVLANFSDCRDFWSRPCGLEETAGQPILLLGGIRLKKRIANFACVTHAFVLTIVSALGGDPAADSPTATLLRLNPPCKA